jgi:pyruvate, water dikinase
MAEAAPQHTRDLGELRAADAGRFGGKSASLGELLDAGIPVPPGFAIGTSAGEELTDGVRDELAQRYERLGEEVPVAVRSSAIGEDSAEATFAGQQETYLWVSGIDAIGEAVQKCWASLYSPEAVSYREHLGDRAPRPAMGVTVQLMIGAAVSGVMFTCNPVTGDPSMVAINASWGLGVAVVGGEVTPDDYLVSKVTGEVVRQTINAKTIEYVPAPSGTGTARVEVVGERQNESCLDDAQIHALVDLGKRIERHFGRHQDVEWAIDHNGDLFVLQSRPVTGLPERPKAPPPASALSLVMSKFGAAGR